MSCTDSTETRVIFVGARGIICAALAVLLTLQAPPACASSDETATFKVKVNLVEVPVVVRDREGRAVGNLKPDDFELLDKGKRQVISKFSVESSAGRSAAPPASAVPGVPTQAAVRAPVAFPDRYVAYLFDDLHLAPAEAARVLLAAERHLAGSLTSTDRVAVYSTSGQVTLDFTADRDALRAAVLRIRSRRGAAFRECPDIGHYMADHITNKTNPRTGSPALDAATRETMACMGFSKEQRALAEGIARDAARRVLLTADHDARTSMNVLKAVVRRVTAMPGERTILLVSPGFLITDGYLNSLAQLLELAVHSNVIVGALDARGLYTDSIYDITMQTPDPEAARVKFEYQRAGELAQADVLGSLAAGTGGTFVHNSNDFERGFDRAATAPEYRYVLGFSPPDLQPDGSFHKLKVSVKSHRNLTVQVRRGYYAPRTTPDPVETAKREIQDALFSREQMNALPVELRTGVVKSESPGGKLQVLARMPLKQLRFRKSGGRNINDVAFVFGLFDRDGNYITGTDRLVQMQLTDETLANKEPPPGITVRTSFDLKPGSYLVRLVVRDSEDQLMSAENAAVEIP